MKELSNRIKDFTFKGYTFSVLSYFTTFASNLAEWYSTKRSYGDQGSPGIHSCHQTEQWNPAATPAAYTCRLLRSDIVSLLWFECSLLFWITREFNYPKSDHSEMMFPCGSWGWSPQDWVIVKVKVKTQRQCSPALALWCSGLLQ